MDLLQVNQCFYFLNEHINPAPLGAKGIMDFWLGMSLFFFDICDVTYLDIQNHMKMFVYPVCYPANIVLKLI